MVVNEAIHFLGLSAAAYLAFRLLLSSGGSKRFPPLTSGAVLITGTSSGIGRRTALFLAKKGFLVLAGVRKQADGDALKAEGGPNLRPVIIDVAQQSTINDCLKKVTALLEAEGVPLIGLINNAGLMQDSTVEFHAQDDIAKMFNVNLFGLIAVTQKFLPLIRKSKGRIINIGSVAGKLAFARFGAYCASKSAVEGITDSLRLELEEYGVAVALIQPGFCKTELFERGSLVSASSHAAKPVNIPKEVLDVYGDLYSPALERKFRRPMEEGSDPGVVVDAIHHALTSAYPKSRYPVARINKAPVWLVLAIRSILPDRMYDKAARTPE